MIPDTPAKMTPPDVSVIMPTHNTNAEWLTAAVRSVLSDTGCDLELIVIDDHSDQPAREVLSPIEDARLRIEKSNGFGQSAARNHGIDLASGRWIRHFDSDDVATPGSTSYLLSLTSGDPAVASYGAFVECDANLTAGRTVTSDWSGWIAERMMKDPDFDIYHWCMLIPRDALLRIGGWDTNITHSVDWDLVLRVADEVPFVSGTEVVAHYRRHSGSVSTDAAVNGLNGIREAHAKALRRHPEWVGTHVEASARLQLLVDEIGWSDSRRSLLPVAGSLGKAMLDDPRQTLGYAALSAGPLARVTASRLLKAVGRQ